MAVINDDIAALDSALAAADGDCNVKHHNELLDTPLVLAIQLGRVRMVEHLIAVGAEVDSGTPCKVAAIVGDERIMKMLIQAGANVRTRAYGNRSLCRYAAKNADAGVLRALIEAGASFDDDRPIVAAVQNENEEVLSILLAAGCSLEPSDDLAATAASNCNHNVLAMLMNAGIDVNLTYGFGNALIHRAAGNPNVAVARLLIDAGVDVNVLDRNDENPLFYAYENPNMEVLDALLAAGAEWHDVGQRRTICHAAAMNDNEAIVRRVIARDVDVNARNAFGRTPLMIAAAHSTATVVSIFLEAGADVHATDNDQWTACYFACMNTDPAITRMLLSAGTPFSGNVLKVAFSAANFGAVQLSSTPG